MRTLGLCLVLAGATGCSFVLDPDDHLGGGGGGSRCDVDADGVEGPQCGGPDCADDDGTRYPGATPTCDGSVARNCWSNELDGTVQALFGANGTPEFGYLSRHTDYTLRPAVDPSGPIVVSPRLGVLDSAEQAAVAFLSGDPTAGNAPRVSIYAYDPMDPGAGQLLDPGFVSTRKFTLGASGPDQLVVAAMPDAGMVQLSHRGIHAGAVGEPPALDDATFVLSGAFVSGTALGGVALLGGHDATSHVTHPASLGWVEVGGASQLPVVRKLPVGQADYFSTRFFDLPANATDQARLVESGGPLAFFSDVPTGGVFTHTVDSGDPIMPSGSIAERAEFQRGAGALPDLAYVPGSTPDTYLVGVHIDDPGEADALLIYSWTSSGQTVSSPLRVAGVDLEDFAVAPLYPGSVVLAVRGRELATGRAGGLLYSVAVGASVDLRPLARPDELQRPFLIRPDEENGRDWVRLDVAAHVDGLTTTVLVTGISEDASAAQQTVSVAGVRACMY